MAIDPSLFKVPTHHTNNPKIELLYQKARDFSA